MKIRIILMLQLVCTVAFARQEFDIKNASPYFDVKIDIENCGQYSCSGDATYSFYKKGNKAPYQVIHEPKSYFELNKQLQPILDDKESLEQCSGIDIADYNFDGMDDIAICTDTVGAYGRILFRIYLSSREQRQFVYNVDFSLAGLYVPVADTQKKVLLTFDKDGCCWRIATTYSVVNNKPKKISEEIEDATIKDTTKVKVTTKTLVNGKWRTVVNMVPRNQ